MSKKFFLRQFSPEVVETHLQDHIKVSKDVEERRKREVEAVLGSVPTFAECEAARKKLFKELGIDEKYMC